MASFTMNPGANISAPFFRGTGVPDYLGDLGEYASPQGPQEDFWQQLVQVMLGNAPPNTPQMGNIQSLLAGVPSTGEEMLRADKKWSKRQFEHDQAAQRESFGKMGARFGTDLATAQSRSGEDFRLGLNKNILATRMGLAEAAKNRSLQALQSILGAGQFGTGLEFTRGESSASRRMEELLQKLRNEGALDVAGLQAESALDLGFLENLLGGGLP